MGPGLLIGALRQGLGLFVGISKNRGGKPPNHPFVHRFSMKKTIHFGGPPPFLETSIFLKPEIYTISKKHDFLMVSIRQTSGVYIDFGLNITSHYYTLMFFAIDCFLGEIHPQSLTWNLTMMVSKAGILFSRG